MHEIHHAFMRTFLEKYSEDINKSNIISNNLLNKNNVISIKDNYLSMNEVDIQTYLTSINERIL